MAISRRTILRGAGALPLSLPFVTGSFRTAFAQNTLAQNTSAQASPAGTSGGEIPPILFVHGNGDHAALWMTTLWRMETNGVPRDRMFAINFTDPLARTDDTKPEPNKSSTEDNRRELADAVKELKQRTGASRVALVGNSRGGNSIRNFIKNGGGADVSHAVLCGMPNHGVYAWDQSLGSEFNGARPFPARPERGRQRGDAGHGVPHFAQRRHGQVRPSRWRARRQAGRADRNHHGRTGAEGRDQSRDRSSRSPRDRVFAAGVCRDVSNSSPAASRNSSRSRRKRKSN